MNIHLDKEADEAYHESTLPSLNPNNLRQRNRWRMYKEGNKQYHEITGHWRKKILEEIRMQNSKQLATQNKDHWGNCPEKIRWDYMKVTNPTKTIKEKKSK